MRAGAGAFEPQPAKRDCAAQQSGARHVWHRGAPPITRSSDARAASDRDRAVRHRSFELSRAAAESQTEPARVAAGERGDRWAS